MNAPAGTAVIAPDVATARTLGADDKRLPARAAVTCPMEHTCV
jgi:hypothetical protein